MGDEIQELVDLDATADRILGLLDVSDTVLLLCHGVLKPAVERNVIDGGFG